MPISDRERRNLAKADGLNAILSQSSIKEGSESAYQRGQGTGCTTASVSQTISAGQ